MISPMHPAKDLVQRDRGDRVYFVHRAEQELEQAQRSDHPGVVRSHYQLAALYLDLVHNEEAFKNWLNRRSVDWEAVGICVAPTETEASRLSS